MAKGRRGAVRPLFWAGPSQGGGGRGGRCDVLVCNARQNRAKRCTFAARAQTLRRGRPSLQLSLRAPVRAPARAGDATDTRAVRGGEEARRRARVGRGAWRPPQRTFAGEIAAVLRPCPRYARVRRGQRHSWSGDVIAPVMGAASCSTIGRRLGGMQRGDGRACAPRRASVTGHKTAPCPPAPPRAPLLLALLTTPGGEDARGSLPFQIRCGACPRPSVSPSAAAAHLERQ